MLYKFALQVSIKYGERQLYVFIRKLKINLTDKIKSHFFNVQF